MHFTAIGVPSQRNQSDSFRFKRVAFFQSLKSKCKDTPSRPHATTTPYDPRPPRRDATTHVTTRLEGPILQLLLYSIQISKLQPFLSS
jgi:hypothetical protein